MQRAPVHPPAAQTASSERLTGPAPQIGDEVLRSPGRPLDAVSRAPHGGSLGHDFGQIRVHTDARAASSARER